MTSTCDLSSNPSPKSSELPLLVLVDGSSYLFRAFHGLPALTNQKGHPTGAIQGVMSMLDKLKKQYPTEYMVVVFDAKGKTFRNDLFPDYKANRPPMPDELRCQIEPLHEMIRAEGYPLVIIPEVEADDVIGSFSRQYKGRVLISTGDKDMAQLVDERVALINTMSNTYYDVEGVYKKYGVRPNQMRDYLTLVGDSVDNIPGVNKVGPKTAAKWLSHYETLQNIMDNANQIKGKVGEYLRDALDYLPLSYQLVTIKCDLDLDLSKGALIVKPKDNERLVELYEEYNLRSRLACLNVSIQTTDDERITRQHGMIEGDLFAPVDTLSTHDNQSNSHEVDYETVLTMTDLKRWVKYLKRAKLLAFDTETTSLNYMQAEIVGLSFAIPLKPAVYIPCGHDYEGAPKQLSCNEVLAVLTPLLESDEYLKIGQNLKYDRSVLLNHGVTLRGIEHDTMLESYVINSTLTRHNMDALSHYYLDYKTTSFESVAGKGKKQLTFNQIELDKATAYAAEDADVTLRLHQHLWPLLEALPKQTKLYREIEMPLISVLSTIERNGVMIDSTLLLEQSRLLAIQMDDLQKKSYQLVGEPFNLSSPKQLQVVLFEKMALPILKKTPKGAPSTAEEVLITLAEVHELPRLILEYRRLSKLKSTYTDKLPKQVDLTTGRIHTSYHQAITATGRLSSADPNLQNIPIRTEEGKKIRQAFITPKGRKIVAIDYSQIELRIMAHLSDDKGLLTAFSEGKDVHSATASEVFNISLDQVTDDHRRSAKAINFGLIYGMSAFGLAKQLKVSRTQAQDYIDLYFSRYPGVFDYMEQAKTMAHEQGYVETLLGRRLYLPDITSRNHQRRQYAERSAINAPMQGTAADIIKKAMIAIDHWQHETQVDGLMIMQVHDELVFEVNEAIVDDFVRVASGLMEHVVELKVPLLVESGIGNNWQEAH